MRVLLVSPKNNYPLDYEECPSRALLLLGTMAKALRHDVKIIHQEIEPVEPYLEWADVTGISVNTFKVKHAKEIAARVKNRVVIGGPHAAYYDGYASDIVVGPGENRWLEILGADTRITTLDDLPIPDYSLIDFKRFSGVMPVGDTPSTAIMASTGCPGECTFCNTPLFWGRKVSHRSPAKVVEEVKLLHERYGMREIFFQDDTFNVNKAWAWEIFERITHAGLNQEMVFRLACRASFADAEFLARASRAGVWSIFYGIESGSQKMLDSMKKHTTVKQGEDAIRLTHEAGIKAQCSFIVGLPGETIGTLRETETFISRTIPNEVGIGVACPFPGTELDRIVTERGHKRNIPYEEYRYGKVICRTEALDYPFFDNLRSFTIS